MYSEIHRDRRAGCKFDDSQVLFVFGRMATTIKAFIESKIERMPAVDSFVVEIHTNFNLRQRELLSPLQ